MKKLFALLIALLAFSTVLFAQEEAPAEEPAAAEEETVVEEAPAEEAVVEEAPAEEAAPVAEEPAAELDIEALKAQLKSELAADLKAELKKEIAAEIMADMPEGSVEKKEEKKGPKFSYSGEIEFVGVSIIEATTNEVKENKNYWEGGFANKFGMKWGNVSIDMDVYFEMEEGDNQGIDFDTVEAKAKVKEILGTPLFLKFGKDDFGTATGWMLDDEYFFMTMGAALSVGDVYAAWAKINEDDEDDRTDDGHVISVGADMEFADMISLAPALSFRIVPKDKDTSASNDGFLLVMPELAFGFSKDLSDSLALDAGLAFAMAAGTDKRSSTDMKYSGIALGVDAGVEIASMVELGVSFDMATGDDDSTSNTSEGFLQAGTDYAEYEQSLFADYGDYGVSSGYGVMAIGAELGFGVKDFSAGFSFAQLMAAKLPTGSTLEKAYGMEIGLGLGYEIAPGVSLAYDFAMFAPTAEGATGAGTEPESELAHFVTVACEW